MGNRNTVPFVYLHRPGFKLLEASLKTEGAQVSAASVTFEKRKSLVNIEVPPGIYLDNDVLYEFNLRYDAEIFVKDLTVLNLDSATLSCAELSNVLLSRGQPGNYTRPPDDVFSERGILAVHAEMGDIQKGRGHLRIVPSRSRFRVEEGMSSSHVVCAYDAADVLHFYFCVTILNKRDQGKAAHTPKNILKTSLTSKPVTADTVPKDIPAPRSLNWDRLHYMYLVILVQFAILTILLWTFSSQQHTISEMIGSYEATHTAELATHASGDSELKIDEQTRSDLKLELADEHIHDYHDAPKPIVDGETDQHTPLDQLEANPGKGVVKEGSVQEPRDTYAQESLGDEQADANGCEGVGCAEDGANPSEDVRLRKRQDLR